MENEFKTLTGLTLSEAAEKLAVDFPQSALKERTGSGGKLSSINPAYEIERLNEVFGLCGIGWKYSNGEFTVHPAREGGKIEAYVTTEVSFQFAYFLDFSKGMTDILWSAPIPACGQGSVHSGMAIGDAHKSAVTDALTKAASMIGVGISVFKGEQSHRGPRPGQDIADKAREKREAAQAAAQKKADLQAKVKESFPDAIPEDGYTINQAYSPKHEDEPVVYFEGRFSRKQPSKSGKMQYIFKRTGGGKDVWVPESMLMKYGNGRVYITHWISEKFIQDEKLTADEVVARCDDDELMESEWNLPPISDEDIPF